VITTIFINVKTMFQIKQLLITITNFNERQPDQSVAFIPTTVTDFENGPKYLLNPNQADGKILQDLYRILVKMTAENKSLKLSLSEYQDIMEKEVGHLAHLLLFPYEF
jgi:hypothetical protein